MAIRLTDVFNRFSFRAPRNADRMANRTRRRRASSAAIPCESLESRAMLAVTATLNVGVLEIDLDDNNDIAALAFDGTDYTLTGTGFVGPTFAATDVNEIRVSDIGTGKTGQQFEFSGTSAVTVPLTVVGGAELVESVTLTGVIDSTGNIVITTGAFVAQESLSATALTIDATTVLADDLTATAGDVFVTASGSIQVNGAVEADQGSISLDAGTDLNISGLTKANNDVTLAGADSVTTVGDVESTNGGTVSMTTANSAGLVWVEGNVTTTGDLQLGDAFTVTVKIGNSAAVQIKGGMVDIEAATEIRFQTNATVESTNQGVSLDGPITSSASNLTLIGAAGVSTSDTLTLDAGDLDVTATAGDVALNGDVSATSGTVTLVAESGTLAAHRDITSGGNLSLTTSATFTASTGFAFTSTSGEVSINADIADLALDDLMINAFNDVTLNGDAGIASTGLVQSQTGDIAVTSGNDIDMAVLQANDGEVSVTSQAGSITVGQTNARGDIKVEAALDIATTGPLTSTTGNVLLQGLLATPARDITVGGDITALDGDVHLLAAPIAGVVRLADGVIVSAKTVTAEGSELSLLGSAEIAASVGPVTLPTTVNAGGTLTLSGPSVEVNGLTLLSGNVAIIANTGNILVNGDLVAAGSITLTANFGTVADHENLTAGSDLTINVADFTAKAGFAFTAGALGTGTITIEAAAGDLDLSGLAGTPAGIVAGADVTLTASNGNLTVGLVDAGSDITVSAAGAGVGLVTILEGLVSLAGDVSVNAVNIEIDDAALVDATAGTITLTASNTVASPLGSEIQAQFIATALEVLANGANAPADVRFTNPDNKVSTLSIKLEDSALPPTANGLGIEFVNDTSLTVTNAVTNRGPVTLSSLNGALTIEGTIGAGTGVQVSGITLAGKTGVTIEATSGLTVGAAGDASITSSAGPISVLAAVTLSDGNLTIDANRALDVSAALEVNGTGKNIELTSGLGMDLTANLTSNEGTVTIDVQGGPNGLQATATKIYARGAITITATNGATISAGAGNPAVLSLTGPISVTSTTGAIAVTGNVVANAGSVTIDSGNDDDVTISGSITATGGASDVSVIAGDDLDVTGDITAGNDIALQANDQVTVGGGSGNTLVATTGSIAVDSVVGDITLNSAATAQNGSIVVEAASGTLTINGTRLVAAPVYVRAIDIGLIRLVGNTDLDLTDPDLLLVAGRLEIVSGGNTDIVMTNSSNTLESVSVLTGGRFEFVNSSFLQITDFDAADPSVQVSASDVDILSAGGLRVVDGIVYLGTNLTLETDVPGGVQFVTTSDGDAAGPFSGSLRNMIGYTRDNRAATANSGATPNRSTIAQEISLLFDEAGAPVDASGTVTLESALPGLTRPVIFDGSLDSGVDVEIDGAAVNGNGLQLAAGSSLSIIRDATFANFASGAGVAVGSARNQVVSSWLRDNAYGLDLSTAAANRNLLGIAIAGEEGNLMEGNGVGIRIRGNAAYNEIYGNTISSSDTDGIVVEASIGTAIGKTVDASFGNTFTANAASGIRVTNVFSTLVPYGASILNNRIDGSGFAGVLIEGGGRNQVGSEAANGANTFDGNARGIVLRSTTAGATQGNLIAGNLITNSIVDGVHVSAGYGNVLRANTVSGSGQAGVRIQNAVAQANRPANQVVRNAIEGNGDGTVGNSDTGGIILDASSGQVIGGAATTAGNQILSNNGSGVVIRSVSATTGGTNQIVGNTISSNLADGVRIRTANGNTVQGNVVAANAENGINIIGSTATTAALGNKVLGNEISENIKAGVRIAGGARTTVGGTLASQANRIYANVGDGVVIEANGASLPAFHTVQGNRIGVDGGNTGYGIRLTSANDTTVNSGNVIRDNGSGGVLVQGGARNMIGATTAARGNQILANDGNGITIVQPTTGPATTQAVTVAANSIQDNTGYAIEVTGSRTQAITIGRTPSIAFPNGSENVIRGNESGGVRVDAARQVTIVGNEFYGNGAGVASDISLANSANGSIASPTIVSATARLVGMSNPQYDVRGTVPGPAGQKFYVDLYGIRNDGRMFFLGRVLVTAGAGNTAAFRAVVGPTRQQLGNGGGINSIVATSTSAVTFGGGTSAFSAEFPV